MSFSPPLSVLDLAPISTGSDAGTAVTASVALAKRAEELGFNRYWVAEHHNMPGIASSAPTVLIARLAAATEHIRVGSGGVMLPNHPPLVVAEQFGLLTAMFPDRIDLGIGRAPGTDPVTAAALRRSANGLSAEDFPQQLGELRAYFAGQDGMPAAIPAAGNAPPLWLLGSSGYSAKVAGVLGLPFAFAHHFSARNTLPALRLYRENFRPSEALARPHAMVAASVICAPSAERARYLAGSSMLSFLRLRQGKPSTLPSPEEAAAYPYTDAEHAVAADRADGAIVGDPDDVRTGIRRLLADTQADELMVTTMVHDPADRLVSYELLADALSHPPQ